MNTLIVLDQNGFGSSKLKKRIKGFISKEIKLSGDQLIGASNATLDVADAMEQDFDNRISIAMQD